MKNYSRLENRYSKFLCRGRMRVNFLAVDRCGGEMMMSQMSATTIIDVLQLGFRPVFQHPWVGVHRCCRSSFLQYLAVDIGEISRGTIFDKKNENGGGHGDGAGSSSICRSPKIGKTWVG